MLALLVRTMLSIFSTTLTRLAAHFRPSALLALSASARVTLSIHCIRFLGVVEKFRYDTTACDIAINVETEWLKCVGVVMSGW